MCFQNHIKHYEKGKVQKIFHGIYSMTALIILIKHLNINILLHGKKEKSLREGRASLIAKLKPIKTCEFFSLRTIYFNF